MSHAFQRVVADPVPGVPRVAIVIVTYNSAGVLGGCLRSLSDGMRGVRLTGIVVVDNASTDETLRVATGAPGLPIRTIQMGRNAGYAAGFNAGIRALRGREPEAVLLINPDCRLRPGSLARLMAALRTPQPEALTGYRRGIAAPRLIHPDGSLQPTLRRMPTVRGAMVEALVGGRRAGRLGELVFDAAAHDRPGPAVWATGAAMLISWETLVDVGLWDESFLLYSEETEFALRAADLGWTLWYEPAAVVEHIGGESRTNPALAALLAVNKVRLFRRRHGPVASAAYYGAVLLGEAVRALAGRRTSRACMLALVRPSRRPRSLAELS